MMDEIEGQLQEVEGPRRTSNILSEKWFLHALKCSDDAVLRIHLPSIPNIRSKREPAIQ